MVDDDGSRLILSASAIGSLLALLSGVDVSRWFSPGWPPDGVPFLLALLLR
jgi:hypothetical protein